MVNIFKGNDKLTVTNGAFETIFKPLGYNIFIETTVEEKPKVVKPEIKKDTVIEKKVSSKKTIKKED